MASGLAAADILRIAAEVRRRTAEGQRITNLTIGDFSPAQFRPPGILLEKTAELLREGQTNYPPPEGIAELREGLADLYADRLGVEVAPGSIVVGSGARPPIFATAASILDPGEAFVYGVPTWNCHYYVHVTGADPVVLATRAEDGFFPTRASLEPHLSRARLLHLNNPLNPCGTVIEEGQLREICEAVVEENHRREREGGKALVLLHDMVYWLLTYGDARFVHPRRLVPEIAPYLVDVDAVSKWMAGTGLRVGWAIAPPSIKPTLQALIGHMGAWAPKAEQLGAAWTLRSPDAFESYLDELRAGLEARLDILYAGFRRMADRGFPVDAIRPQGAIYLSMRLDLVGRRTAAGEVLDSDEAVRTWLLDEAGVALIPFGAFGHRGEGGWFRASVGAAGIEELEEVVARIERAVAEVGVPVA